MSLDFLLFLFSLVNEFYYKLFNCIILMFFFVSDLPKCLCHQHLQRPTSNPKARSLYCLQFWNFRKLTKSFFWDILLPNWMLMRHILNWLPSIHCIYVPGLLEIENSVLILEKAWLCTYFNVLHIVFCKALYVIYECIPVTKN